MIHFKTFTKINRPRGFTLLVALIFTSVILSVGLALTDIAYKQIILASTARQSEYAFYNADSALECALEQDQKLDTFDYTSGPTQGSFMCVGANVTYTNPLPSGGLNIRIASFDVPCSTGSGDPSANVKVFKDETRNPAKTVIYANGFNDCNASNPQRVERGLQSHY